MWKRLFYEFFKPAPKNASRVYGEETNQRLANNFRNEILNEYENDIEQQQFIMEVDDQLEYLITTNSLCIYCVMLLESSSINSDVLDLIIDEIELLSPRSMELLESGEFMSEEHRQRMVDIVSPYLNITKVMFGDSEEGDSDGVIGFYNTFINSDNESYEIWEGLRSDTLNFLYDTKARLREVFIENKRFQVTSYVAYDVEGEVDFGIYTLDDLD